GVATTRAGVGAGSSVGSTHCSDKVASAFVVMWRTPFDKPMIEQGAPSATSSGPGTPCAPGMPGGPVGPAGPVSPLGPCGPAAPVAPTAPTSPFGPCGPSGPVGPCWPCRFQVMCVCNAVQCPSRLDEPSDVSISRIVPVAFNLQAV